jgi:hypothetical protein
MSAEELKEFFAAMEQVRQANAAFSEVMGDLLDQDDDFGNDNIFADLSRPVTLH